MAQHGTVTGEFVDALEQPQTGSVIFTAAPGWILSATEAKTIVPEQVVVALDGTGSLSQQLLATDDTTLNPTGWTWNALILIDGAPARAFSFSLPTGTTVDLTTASPANGSQGTADMTSAAAIAVEASARTAADALLQPKSSLETDVSAKLGTGGTLDSSLATSYPLIGYSDLLPWFVALGGRETKRANVVMIGASVTEGTGSGITADMTLAQRLATTLRSRFPTKGLTSGGRGHIGQPASATSYPWTYTSAGSQAASVWDETFHVGMNHRTRVLQGDGTAVNYNKATLTLSGSITSFDISFTKTSLGGTNYAYYKIDGGAAVAFSTNAASPTPTLLHIASPATTTIEIGNLTGSLYLDGIVEYNGDENKGIQVHNCGHGSYTTANWNTNATTAGSWAYSIALLSPDLLIIGDLGVNDYVTTIGNKTSAQFKTDLLSLIANLRTAGITCPILLAANYQVNYSGYTYVEPWANYVAAMKAVAAADSTIAFVDHSARMPATTSNSLGIYGSDQIHPTAKGYGMMADTLMAAIAAR